jgi:curved DNA-binding protein CbpA
VERDSSIRQIKRIYKKLAKEWHPDLHPGDPAARIRMQEINEAYEVLGNPEKRRTYDRRSKDGGPDGLWSNGFYPDSLEDPFFRFFRVMSDALRKKTRE